MSRKPKSSEIISNILNCSLLFPIITRWNSLFDSVSQLLKYRYKLNTLTKEFIYKLRWIPENNDVDKKRIQNLCINTVEKFVMETSVIDTSAEADEDDFLVFSSQDQTKADSKANLEVIQFLMIKINHYQFK